MSKSRIFVLERSSFGSMHISETCYYNYDFKFTTPITKSNKIRDFLKSLKKGDMIELKIFKRKPKAKQPKRD